MVRPDLVREKARRLAETLSLLRRVLPGEAAALAADVDARDLVAFRVYLAVQQCIDLAAHILADEGWGPAPSLREHFTILAAHGVVDEGSANALSAAVKVRNLVGHAYVAVDPSKLHEAARELLPLAERFREAVLRFADTARAAPAS